jgi:F-type H+-transporting ATPase subunit delta
MISSAVFHRYARSLADVAFENNEEPTVTSELSVYSEIFKSVPDLVGAIDSPAVTRDAKERLLGALLEKYPVSRTTANFLRVVVDHHRIRYFEEICLAYIKLVNERKGIVAARVTVARNLLDAELVSLRKSLSEATGKAVTLDVETDPETLGGLVVQIGSTVYDGSIRSQLDEVKKRLAEA